MVIWRRYGASAFSRVFMICVQLFASKCAREPLAQSAFHLALRPASFEANVLLAAHSRTLFLSTNHMCLRTTARRACLSEA